MRNACVFVIRALANKNNTVGCWKMTQNKGHWSLNRLCCVFAVSAKIQIHKPRARDKDGETDGPPTPHLFEPLEGGATPALLRADGLVRGCPERGVFLLKNRNHPPSRRRCKARWLPPLVRWLPRTERLCDGDTRPPSRPFSPSPAPLHSLVSILRLEQPKPTRLKKFEGRRAPLCWINQKGYYTSLPRPPKFHRFA